MKRAPLAAGEWLRLNGLPERDPESVEVTNNELTHAVEGIINVYHDLNPVLEASVQVIDVVGQYVQVRPGTAATVCSETWSNPFHEVSTS